MEYVTIHLTTVSGRGRRVDVSNLLRAPFGVIVNTVPCVLFHIPRFINVPKEGPELTKLILNKFLPGNDIAKRVFIKSSQYVGIDFVISRKAKNLDECIVYLLTVKLVLFKIELTQLELESIDNDKHLNF